MNESRLLLIDDVLEDTINAFVDMVEANTTRRTTRMDVVVVSNRTLFL